jgi:hypothetical protein
MEHDTREEQVAAFAKKQSRCPAYYNQSNHHPGGPGTTNHENSLKNSVFEGDFRINIKTFT